MMQDLKHIICQKRNIVGFLLLEIIVIAVYSLVAVTTFSADELLYEEDDMQLKNQSGTIVDGNYLDTSYADAEAVVTPAFRLRKGIYYIEASYARHGIVRAGLIYDIDRNGKNLVDNDEFILNPDKQTISYRVKIHDDSKIRFKLRLTGDAAEGDYVQLLQMRVTASKLTYVYRIFCLISCLFVIDFIVWIYLRYYSRWNTERKMVSLVLIITTFFIGLPLYHSGLSNGVDLVFHLSRLDGIYKSLKFGGGGTQFPVRIQTGWLDGYGYAVSIFYGDIFMYVPALLRAVGFTLEEAYKAYLQIVNIATVFVSFYAFKKITRNDISAMIGSVLYSGSIQRVTLMYSVVLGGVSGMVFYPLILAGFWLLFTENINSKEYKRIWILLTFGFTGILMTHMISCLIIGLYSVLVCIVMLKRLLRKNTMIQLLKAAGMAVLLNLWYLIPFLQYMFHEKLRINSKIAAKTLIEDYYAALEDFAQEGKSLYNFFTDNDTLGVSILIVLLTYIVSIPVQKKCKWTTQVRIFSLFTLFTIFVCTDMFPVVTLAKRSDLLTKFFQTIQYQYRLMSVTIVMAACLAALFFTMDMFERKKLYYIAGALCCITLYQNIQYFATLSFDAIYLDSIALESRTDKELYSYTVGNGEYLPIMFKTTELTDEVVSEELVSLNQVQREGLFFEVTVENQTSEEKDVLFPILYYGGYRARDVANYKELKTGIGDNGRVAVTIPPNYSGTFHVGFYEPPLWRIAEVISAITLIVMIMLMYKPQVVSRLVKGNRQAKTV